ncbi:MAG: alpha/beta hydrolase fold [Enterovirga sp.]|nr:alpha/beta hydrolase fold [Enterovirga sp.]
MTASSGPHPADRPRRTSRSRYEEIRGVRYHLREWGAPDGPVLVLLHGARDASPTFQFVVDALDSGWRIVAPDWRGHGLTAWTPGSYWHAEFLCDLDVILDLIAPGRAVPIVGHSMGGNMASLYAGIRPERVSRLVLLDALGELLDRSPVRIDEILTLVLDSRTNPPREHRMDGAAALAERLLRGNRRLGPDQAAMLAEAYARELPDGKVGWPYDPAFRRSFPTMHVTEDWAACWRRIEAPVLGLLSTDFRPDAPTSHPDVVAARAAYFRRLRLHRVPETGHNIHHDAPTVVAREIEAFLAEHPTAAGRDIVADAPLTAARPPLNYEQNSGPDGDRGPEGEPVSVTEHPRPGTV